MSMNISQRDKKVLTAGLVFVVCYILFFFVVEPVYKKQAKADKKINVKFSLFKSTMKS